MQVVRTFQRTTEPSFPDNDALPKKEEDEKKFDKTFNEWYDDMKVNLDRLQDQLKTFYQTDLSDSLESQKKSTGDTISSVNKTLVTSLQNVSNILQSVRDNLYSE
jgi:hypothetical protein